jgi:hypothetical protein|uniref:Uncharacterized protein n=1 Tax=Eutreptiella gymnastica TaxID=73025 RepID=A0A7S4GEQ1_9EUGL|mmetsp:Transcript_82987/g.138694  ORF Transcript_82987/g.138694 Transcript_82987/m.138694 type:complete len:122 (-) Transcript_82987:154-519(-)
MLQYLNDSWVGDFKWRQGWTWRSTDTDRPPTTLADLVQDNKWRLYVADVFDNPTTHVISMPEGVTSIPQRPFGQCEVQDTDPQQVVWLLNGCGCDNFNFTFISSSLSDPLDTLEATAKGVP